jgi:hypothetical protein
MISDLKDRLVKANLFEHQKEEGIINTAAFDKRENFHGLVVLYFFKPKKEFGFELGMVTQAIHVL